MAVMFGVMLHVDRGPAAVVTPPAHPSVVEAAVIAPSSSVVPSIELSSRGQFRGTYSPPSAKPVLTYDLHGERRASGGQTGSKLDLFA